MEQPTYIVALINCNNFDVVALIVTNDPAETSEQLMRNRNPSEYTVLRLVDEIFLSLC